MTETKVTVSHHPSPTERSETVALSKSEEKFRLVLEASPDGYIILRSVQDVAGTIVDFIIDYANPVAAKAVNRTSEALLGQPLLQLFPDCQTRDLVDCCLTVAKTGISEAFETFYDSKELTGWFRHVVVKVNDGVAVSLSKLPDRKRLEDDRQRANQRQQAQYAIARILAEAATVAKAIPAILQALGEPLDWQVGVIWHIDPNQSVLRSIGCWQAPDVNVQALVEATQQITFAKDVGLPGQVWGCRQPLEFSQLDQDSNPRAILAVQLGLQFAFGFPIQLGDAVLGVIECFSKYVQELDVDLLQMMAAIGSQMGQFMERKRTEAALRESQEQSFMIQAEAASRQREAELRLLTNAVPVLISFVDTEQRYRFTNQRYEEWFGRSAAEVNGKYLWDVLGEATYKTIRPYVEQVLAGQAVTFESKISHEASRTRDVVVTYVPRFDQQGTVEGFVALVDDVTHRKQTEAALRESEAWFQAIVRNVPGTLYRYTSHPDGSDAFTYVSEGSRELLELEPETIIQDSSSIWALFHPDDLPALRESVAVVVENLLPWQWEGRLITPSGQLKWIQGRSRPQQTEQGTVWDGLLIDITERKQAEQALRRSEEWARLAIHVGRLGGWRLHLETNLVEMDDRMREIWGEPSDAVMIPLPSVIERMHPDDRARVTSAVNVAIDPQSSGTYEIDYRLVWNDGTERWVLAKGQAQREDEGESQRTVAFFGTLLDITDRKQAEAALRNSAERLSLALTAAKLGDWSWQVATDIVTLSEQAASMFSIPSGSHMTWAQMQDLLYPDDRGRARLQVEQAIADHSDYDIEYRVMQPDGTTRWIAAKGRAQYDLSGQVLGMLGVVQDITHRKQADAEREQLLVRAQVAREEAEKANRIKDEFLAVLSHELRSPLNPILGWSKLLQQGNLDATRTTNALATIERNAKLQVQLIDDLLDISRILRGKLTLNTLPVSLSFVLTAAIDTVRLAIDAKAIQLKLAVDPGVGQVLGDAARLQQVVWNLLANAAKFTPSGGQITVTLTQVETCAQLQVKDTGKGIHPTFLPAVFEHFRQEDGATTRQFGGLGLGLAIVRQIVEMHGGSVQAASPGEGLGATFTVKLPLAKSGSNQVQTTHLDTPAVDFKGLRVLVVDDEADMRELAAFVLEQQGATVITAASAQEALTVLDRCAPDVLLSDIGMPEVDGYMLMQQVRSRAAADGGQIPAIALTAYAGEVDQQQALAAGFQQHLAKPIEPMILVEAIASLIHQSQQEESKP